MRRTIVLGSVLLITTAVIAADAPPPTYQADVKPASDEAVRVMATVFAEGFNSHVSGIGAGVLARQGRVWYTCIPDLWMLQDTKGSGTADVRTSLSTGYGVHTGFIGHDLHGLRMGPDGKLYFS